MGRPIIPVLTYMRTVLEEHRDPQTDEINTTTLAEDAADHLDLMEGADYETPEWVFFAADQLAERDKARRNGRYAAGLGEIINSLNSDAF